MLNEVAPTASLISKLIGKDISTFTSMHIGPYGVYEIFNGDYNNLMFSLSDDDGFPYTVYLAGKRYFKVYRVDDCFVVKVYSDYPRKLETSFYVTEYNKVVFPYAEEEKDITGYLYDFSGMPVCVGVADRVMALITNLSPYKFSSPDCYKDLRNMFVTEECCKIILDDFILTIKDYFNFCQPYGYKGFSKTIADAYESKAIIDDNLSLRVGCEVESFNVDADTILYRGKWGRFMFSCKVGKEFRLEVCIKDSYLIGFTVR